VEFAGGPMCWSTRTFSALAGCGAYCNGQKIHVSETNKVEQSLLVTGFGYEHDDAWSTNIELFKHYTDISRGVRRLGAASVDMCHVALGIVEAYWEYRLKPWDMAAGVLVKAIILIIALKKYGHQEFQFKNRKSIAKCDVHTTIHVQIVEEAGGAVSQMDGGGFCVFDRSVLVSNGVVHPKLLERIGSATEELKAKGIDFSLWFKPDNYTTDF
ncbi:Inositol monophosphatase-like, partial [Dillenia turbinata]